MWLGGREEKRKGVKGAREEGRICGKYAGRKGGRGEEIKGGRELGRKS